MKFNILYGETNVESDRVQVPYVSTIYVFMVLCVVYRSSNRVMYVPKQLMTLVKLLQTIIDTPCETYSTLNVYRLFTFDRQLELLVVGIDVKCKYELSFQTVTGQFCFCKGLTNVAECDLCHICSILYTDVLE